MYQSVIAYRSKRNTFESTFKRNINANHSIFNRKQVTVKLNNIYRWYLNLSIFTEDIVETITQITRRAEMLNNFLLCSKMLKRYAYQT